jgi:hypothetical protein
MKMIWLAALLAVFGAVYLVLIRPRLKEHPALAAFYAQADAIEVGLWARFVAHVKALWDYLLAILVTVGADSRHPAGLRVNELRRARAGRLGQAGDAGDRGGVDHHPEEARLLISP